MCRLNDFLLLLLFIYAKCFGYLAPTYNVFTCCMFCRWCFFFFHYFCLFHFHFCSVVVFSFLKTSLFIVELFSHLKDDLVHFDSYIKFLLEFFFFFFLFYFLFCFVRVGFNFSTIFFFICFQVYSIKI